MYSQYEISANPSLEKMENEKWDERKNYVEQVRKRQQSLLTACKNVSQERFKMGEIPETTRDKVTSSLNWFLGAGPKNPGGYCLDYDSEMRKGIKDFFNDNKEKITKFIALGYPNTDFSNYFGNHDVFSDSFWRKTANEEPEQKFECDDNLTFHSKFANDIYTVTATEKIPNYFASAFTYQVLPFNIQDASASNLKEWQALRLYSFILDSLPDLNKSLMIHCKAGQGRTGNIFMALVIFLQVTHPDFMNEHFKGLPELTNEEYYFELMTYIRGIRKGLVAFFWQMEDAIRLAHLLIDIHCMLYSKFGKDKISEELDKLNEFLIVNTLTELRELVKDIKDENGVTPEWQYDKKFQEFYFVHNNSTIRQKMHDAVKVKYPDLEKRIIGEIPGRCIPFSSLFPKSTVKFPEMVVKIEKQKQKFSFSFQKEMASQPTPTERLIIAASAGDLEEIKRLIETGLPVETKNEKGCTLLYLAAAGGHDHVVKFLLDHGAEVKTAEEQGTTALHIAIDRSHFFSKANVNKDNIEVIKLLINSSTKDELNILNAIGTPLHYAVYREMFDVVKLLVESGASLDLVGGKLVREKNALDFAKVHCENKEIIHFLEKATEAAVQKNREDTSKFLQTNSTTLQNIASRQVNNSSNSEEDMVLKPKAESELKLKTDVSIIHSTQLGFN